MKKIFTILAMVVSASAFAGGSGVTMEYEGEYGKGKDAGTNGSSVAVAPYIKFGDGWKADVKFDAGRDFGQEDGQNKSIDGKIEGRIRKDIKLTDSFSAGLRIGVGEKFAGKDFSYYTVEPIVTYKATQQLSFNASARYRNAFDTANNFQTTTYKLGTAYKVTNEDEVGVKYFEKFGDSRANGFELVYTRGF
jgi:hypothetical protein